MGRKFKIVSAMSAAALMLSGCVVSGPGGGLPTRQPTAPTFAEGNWQQGDSASYVFGNGNFVGTASDTGNKVADGTYRYTNQNSIQISSFSAVQQKQITANCLLINQVQMNCTSDTGAQFSLVRRVA
ncbi:MAG: hypothetical protein U5K75_03265 [Ahrensia sp.]|nr:hypothetical protein [Ahrensia sp.]